MRNEDRPAASKTHNLHTGLLQGHFIAFPTDRALKDDIHHSHPTVRTAGDSHRPRKQGFGTRLPRAALGMHRTNESWNLFPCDFKTIPASRKRPTLEKSTASTPPFALLRNPDECRGRGRRTTPLLCHSRGKK